MASTTSKSERNRGVIESYPEFLPVSASTPVVSLGEGNTPVIYCSQLSKRAGRGCEALVKNEGVNPTGSFNDRGMTVDVYKALEYGAKALICTSRGNTYSSTATYGARSGILFVVIMVV